MDFLKKDNDFLGIAIGLVCPAATYALAILIKDVIHFMVSTPFLLILCVGVNFIPVQFYTKHNLNKTARGLVLITVFLGLLFFYYKLMVLGD